MAASVPDDSWWSGFVNWLADWYAETLIEFVVWCINIGFRLYDKFLDAFQTMIVNFPVPAAWANSDPWANFSPQLLYLLDKFQIVEVLAIIAAGWTIRWMINTIPFLRI